MQVLNLGYLEAGALCVTELPDGGIEELDLGLGLDHAITISDNNDQLLTDLSDLEAEWAKKKVEKAQRRQQRKITLAQATSSTDVGVLLATVVDGPSFAVSSSGISFALIGSLATGIGALLTASGGPLSPTSDVDFVSTVSGGDFLFPVTGDIGSTFAVFGNDLLSHATGGIGSASTVPSSSLLSPVTGSVSFASAVFGISFFSPVANNSSLFSAASSIFLSAGLPALSLFGTPSCAYRLSLTSSTTPLAGFAMPIAEKRLFNKTLIK